MKKKISRIMKRKLTLLFFIFTLIIISLIGRIIYIKHFNGSLYERRVFAQQVNYNHKIPYKRGDILDRNGSVLATSIKKYNLILDPLVLSQTNKKSQESTKDALLDFFNINKQEIHNHIIDPKGNHYVPLLRQLDYNDIEPFLEMMESKERDYNVKGIWFEEEYARDYKFDSLASDVIGFVANNNQGRWGLEEYYNNSLNGEIGREFGVLTDGLYVERKTRAPKNGHNIITTIDRTIQHYAESALNNFGKKYSYLNAAAIVMNPNNGEVLAMASLPDFNLNDPMNLSEFYEKEEINNMSSEEKKDFLNGVWRNFAISDTYEPGSTFKPITIAAAIEEGILNRDETFLCEGYKVVHDTRINCWEKEGHGEQSITEALSNSCNIALMEIGELIGKELFIKYQKDFGFGQKTQIDLPGEASGENLLYNVNAMGPVELATNSFGQTFNVTPLQLITSISSLINGGELLEPHLVKQIVDEDGRNIKSIDKKVVKKVVSKQTADIVKNYMFEAVLEGTGQKAQISGYEIGGKTGTAEKGFPRGKDKYIVSFVGFTPIENPEVIVLVVVDEPQVKDYDSRYASEIFKEIMTNILPYLNIY